MLEVKINADYQGTISQLKLICGSVSRDPFIDFEHLELSSFWVPDSSLDRAKVFVVKN